MFYTRHLLLTGIYNTRDIGGYETMDHHVTKFGVFLRSDGPCDLSEEDIAELKNYGVNGSLDLRSDGERAARPSSLKGLWPYYEESVFDRGVIVSESPVADDNFSWSNVYISMAEGAKVWTKEVMEIAADHVGCLLYHCTTGKDRTGLVTLFLLATAGVGPRDIAADYSLSKFYLEPFIQKMERGEIALDTRHKQPVKVDRRFFRTKAETMMEVIDYLDGKYGSVIGYLNSCGVKDETLAEIRDKFVV